MFAVNENRTPRTAIYPGTFDPVTKGHEDVIIRASRLFDLVYVAIGHNAGKEPMFSIDERFELLVESTKDIPNVRVITFEGLLVDLYKKMGADVIIRGMRAVSDFEYEFQLGLLNRKLEKNCETLFLIPSEQYIYLDSTVVKTIAVNKGPISSFVSAHVEDAFKKKF